MPKGNTMVIAAQLVQMASRTAKGKALLESGRLRAAVCPCCGGDGEVIEYAPSWSDDGAHPVPCPSCSGLGAKLVEVADEVDEAAHVFLDARPVVAGDTLRCGPPEGCDCDGAVAS